jgi:hypothetical protein
MPTPRISADAGSRNAAGRDASKLDIRDASAGAEFLPLGCDGEFGEVPRVQNAKITAPAGLPGLNGEPERLDVHAAEAQSGLGHAANAHE